MLSKNEIRLIRSLKEKKFREIHHRFLAEGVKLVSELIDSPYEIEKVYGVDELVNDFHSFFRDRNIPFRGISKEEMERITALSSPSPLLALAVIPDPAEPPPSGIGDLVLALDNIRDPGNLGTIVRIADWFGIGSLICSEETVDLYNPKVVQATMGSIARVKVEYRDLPKYLTSLGPDVKIYGCYTDGKNLYETGIESKGILLIGNESNGISPEAAACVTHRIAIPPFHRAGSEKGHAESLNASVAAAVICAEFRRRQG